MAADLPKLRQIHTVRALPNPADNRSCDFIARREDIQLEPAVWLVALLLDRVPEPGGSTFFLHLGDYRVAKYWGFRGGIYFKVFNPRFFTKHGGKEVLFVAESGAVLRSGQRLPASPPRTFAADAGTALPTQSEALARLGGP